MFIRTAENNTTTKKSASTKIKKKNTKNKVNEILINKLNEINKDIKRIEQNKLILSIKIKTKVKVQKINKKKERI